MAPTIVENSISYAEIRASLAAAGHELKARFEAGESVIELVHARAAIIDACLAELWNQHVAGDSGAVLVAVGGYGRGELHPYSDVDIMVLLPDDELPSGTEDGLSAFVTALWDIGLEIGHSVRTVTQCFEEARKDLTIATTLHGSSPACGAGCFVCRNAGRDRARPDVAIDRIFCRKTKRTDRPTPPLPRHGIQPANLTSKAARAASGTSR